MDLVKMTDRNDLVAVGCDQAEVESLAKERNLEIKPLDAPISIQVMIQSAKVLMLCGNITELNKQYVTMNSDEMILNNASIKILGTMGEMKLSTNKRVLKGKNIIEATSTDRVSLISFAPDLELNVLKEIEAEEAATLELKATGANNLPVK